MPLTAVTVVSTNPSRIWMGQHVGSCEPPGPNAKPARRLADITYGTCRMLDALATVQKGIQQGKPSYIGDPSCDFRSLILWVRNLQSEMPRFERELPDLRPNMAAHAGRIAPSYHRVALELCSERLARLMQTVTLKERKAWEKLPEWECAKCAAEVIVSRLSFVQPWQFAIVDADELTQRVSLECNWARSRAKKPSHREKVKARRELSRRLRKEHNTETDWVKLAKIVNADPEYVALGLGELIRDTVRNDCKPRPRTR